MVEIAIDRDYFGPTILELEPVLQEITDEVIKVRWQNTRQEYSTLEAHKDRKFLLIVNDLPTMERVTTVLGIPFKVDSNIVTSAKDALLNKKLYNWRQFTTDVGAGISRSLITKVAADAVRRGKSPKLAYVAKDVLLDNISPADADVLVRLRIMRGF